MPEYKPICYHDDCPNNCIYHYASSRPLDCPYPDAELQSRLTRIFESAMEDSP